MALPKSKVGGSSKGEVDFEGINRARRGGGPAVNVDPGDYLLEVVSCERTKSQKGDPMFTWQFHVLDDEGDALPGILYHRTMLTPKSLPFLDQLLFALGIELPRSKVKIKSILAKIKAGMRCGATLETSEYNDKPRSEVSSGGFFPESEFTEEDADADSEGEDEEEKESDSDEEEEDDKEESNEDEDEEDEDI